MYRKEALLDLYPREYWEHMLVQWVHDEIARKSIARNFLDGIPYEQIAEELDVSRATVFNKIKKYAPKLFKHVD